ncbi:hypothetical protein, partial [Porphyromonas levii]
DVYYGVHELTVVEKIWDIIIEIISIVANLLGAEEEDLITQIMRMLHEKPAQIIAYIIDY